MELTDGGPRAQGARPEAPRPAFRSGEGLSDLVPGPNPELIDDCVHCGFCLPACPTYALWGEEMDSPRGRIYLMREMLEGAPVGTVMQTHFDRCLGCLACVTACPSGVQYDKLIEATRVAVEHCVTRSWRERLLREAIFQLFPYPRRLRLATVPLKAYQRSDLSAWLPTTGFFRRLPPVLRTLESIAPPVPARARPAVPRRAGPADPGAGRPAVPGPAGRLQGRKLPRLPRGHGRVELRRAESDRRGAVAMLTGCVQSVLFSPVNEATAHVLSAEGYDVVSPISQGCCGALSGHAGREEEARRFARATIDAFEYLDVEAVVVNSAGCGSAMKHYAHLLRDDPDYGPRAHRFAGLVRDVAELLATAPPRAERHRLDITIAYHDACHLSHGQGVRAQPRSLLRAIPGLELREIRDGEICCGSAGIYNLLQPVAAAELGDLKAGNVLDSGASLLVAANPGCAMQVAAAIKRRGGRLAVAHTIEVLDASIRGLPASALTERPGSRAR